MSVFMQNGRETIELGYLSGRSHGQDLGLPRRDDSAQFCSPFWYSACSIMAK
jgi:hypothetical protein